VQCSANCAEAEDHEQSCDPFRHATDTIAEVAIRQRVKYREMTVGDPDAARKTIGDELTVDASGHRARGCVKRHAP